MAKSDSAPDSAPLSKYVVERKLTLADVGVAEGEPNAADGSASVRAAFGKIGDAWVRVGETLARSADQALNQALEQLGEKAPDEGTFRVVASRYLGDPTPIKKKVTTSWEIGGK